MKYCRTCKTRAKETDEICAQCGGPLTTFGVPRAAVGDSESASLEPALGLQGEIRKLRKVHRRNVRRSRMLMAVCLLVFVALATTLYLVYDAAVLSFAVLRNVQILQDAEDPQRIDVSFEIVTPGKVTYDRRSGKSRTEKLDVLATRGRSGFSWLWTSDPSTGIDFQVVYRKGLTRETVARHFEVPWERGRP
jgi:hypothetical protein